jgi:cation transport ATPase
LLTRSADQRLREYKYRFSQSVVFGLPVLALQRFGPVLGPTDSQRWVGLLQALLCGWVVYVNLGMLFEGIALLFAQKRLTGDLIVASASAGLYLYSLVSAFHGVVTKRLWYPTLFHLCIMLLAMWTGWQWFRRRHDAAPRSP